MRWLSNAVERDGFTLGAATTLLFLLLSVAGAASAGFTGATGFAAMVLLVFAWAALVRLLWAVPGRAAGFYDLTLFRHFIPRWLIPWRALYLWDNGDKAFGLMRVADWWRLTRLGKGANRRWAGILETLAYVFAPGDRILVGRAAWRRIPLLQPIAVPGGGRHAILVGAPGSGKGLHILTMLGTLHRRAAAFVVDCDGAFVSTIGHSLIAQGHRVIKIDPDGIAKVFTTSGCWNLMLELTRAAMRHGRAAVVAFADRLADALIIPDSQNQPVFVNATRIWIRGVILYVWLCEEGKTLMRVRELITRGLPEKTLDEKEDPFERLIKEMAAMPAYQNKGERDGKPFDDGCEGAICAAIAGSAGAIPVRAGNKENAFRTTAIYQTAWIDDPNIRAMMAHSDFAGEDLKFTNTCVFLCATLSDIQTNRMAPFVRAAFMLTTYAFERTVDIKLKIPAFFVIDEAPQLKIENLSTAAPGFRRCGVRLLLATQSISLLRNSDPKWMDYFSTAQVAIFLGLDDPFDSLKFLSEHLLGSCLRKEKVEGTPWYAFWVPKNRRVPTRYQSIERPLMDERQCAEFLDPSSGHIIVHRFGRRPMRLKRLKSFVELPVWKYDVTPGYPERSLRARTRRLLAGRASGLSYGVLLRNWITGHEA